MLTSCGEQPFGIFASIEREADAEDSAFFGANLRGMARLDDGGTARYIVASGRPQWRRVDSPGDDNWSNAPRPSGFNSSGDWMRSVVGNGSDVYALFRREGSSNRSAIFKWDDGWGSSIASNSSSPFGDDDDWRISRLFLLNDTLVASVRNMDEEEYSLIEVTDTGFTGDPVHTGSKTPFSDATYAPNNGSGTYYFVSRDGVWSGSNVDDLTEDGDAPDGDLSDPPHNDRGVYHYDHNADDYVFLAADDEIWYKENGGNWTEATINNYRSGDRFTRFAEFDGHIFVGSDREGSGTNGGVYRLDTEDLDNNGDVIFRREFDKPSDSPIYRSHVAGLFADLDPDNKHLFALVYSRGDDQPGLWRRDTDSDADWNAE